MIDFEAVEQSVIDLLAPLRDRNILARALPDEPGEVGKLVGNGVVTAVVHMAEKADNASMDMRVQARRYTVTCDVRLKRRRGASGLSQVSKEIDRLLHGQRVLGLGRLEFKSFKELGRTDSTWVAEIAFTALAMDQR